MVTVRASITMIVNEMVKTLIMIWTSLMIPMLTTMIMEKIVIDH